MRLFFKRLPLLGKLVVISSIPIVFAGYLTFQLTNEKNLNINQLKSFIDDIHQSATLTRLIDQMQKEGRLSFNYALTRDDEMQMVKQRELTDSVLNSLKSISDASLQDFTTYTFLEKLDIVRGLIDSNHYQTNQVVDYYSTTIFRLNTLNRPPLLNNNFLAKASSDMTLQRLLSELITYQSIINTNIYNVLFTRKYMIETLLGTYGTYNVYKTYEKEIRAKADAASLRTIDSLHNYSSFGKVDNYLDKVFSHFAFDSSITAAGWDSISTRSVTELRNMQGKMLNNVENTVNAYYGKEKRARTISVILLLLLITFLVVIAFYILTTINSSLTELKIAALKIADGGTGFQLQEPSNDAIGSLANSIRRIDEKNKELATSARQIGDGDFTATVRPRSKEDILGNALLQMKDNLQNFTNDLKRSREEFKKLADFMPQIVWTATPDGTINYYNEKWCEVTGAKEFNEQSWIPALHPDDVDPSITQWRQSVEKGISYEMEYRLKDAKTNTYKWFLGRAVPIKDEVGKIIKRFGTGTDIHDQKMQNEKLEEMVGQRTLELIRSNEDLQQFAHVASHDLKEPVRKLLTFSTKLHDEYMDILPEKGRFYLEKLRSSAGRMEKLIDSILDYSVVNATEENKTTVDLDRLMDDIRNDLELLMLQKNASFNYNGLPKIKAVPALMHQLFYNLCNNALKFSKENVPAIVDISAKKIKASEVEGIDELGKCDNYLRITIRDNGIGFDQEFADKIFDVFSRLNPRNKYEGTGLGLALCKKIVQRHGGFIYAEGKEGEGSAFHIILPAGENGHC